MDPSPALDAVFRPPPAWARTPRSTYRLQFNRVFTFDDASAIIPYLRELGISHVYASPIFAATPGSQHGYDVIDYAQINPDLGGAEGFRRFRDALTAHGLALVVDFVPNHMGIAEGANAWWQDVLENGRASLFAPVFDIDWQPIKPELRNQVLVPVLGDYFGLVLERGELVLAYADGEFRVDYYETPLPLSPTTYPMILLEALAQCENAFEPDDLPLLEFRSIISAFERLPTNDETDPVVIEVRRAEQIVTKHRLRTLTEDSEPVREAVEKTVRSLNGDPEDPASFDRLEALLDAQSYRPAYWRVAAEEINYRRFFAINTLAATRQESEGVFERTHALLLEMIRDGDIDGVRIDHPDGLWDPAGYFADLAAGVGSEADGNSGAWTVIEKILEPGEQVPDDWQIDGTVGYEFARLTTGLFVDPDGRKGLENAYVRFVGERTRFHDLVYDKKKLIMRTALASEVNVLARSLDQLTEQNRRTRDFTLNSLRDAMREVIACFPVYRTYTICGDSEVAERDRRYVDNATQEALRRNPSTDPSALEFLRRVLLLEFAPDANAEERANTCRFVMRFQQLTGPVMAKGLEDTSFYLYNRLLSLNEVGGDPATFGTPVAAFHRDNKARAQQWPSAMLTSSTHDTKRSEDVRARISVLSEIPAEWKAAANRWSKLNRRFKTRVDGALAPRKNDEYHLYQTLIGIWPVDGSRPDAAFTARVRDYMIKVLREGQVYSSWITPNTAFEDAMTRFVGQILAPDSSIAFLEDFTQFSDRVSRTGALNGLAQQVLKLTVPGVPDIYQGTELWDFSLVDPDNRRPVDFEVRKDALGSLSGSHLDPNSLWEDWQDGRVKLAVTRSLLTLRETHPLLFAEGTYEPLEVVGPGADHVIAFRRRWGQKELVVIVPRLMTDLLDGQGTVWHGTEVLLGKEPEQRAFASVWTGAEITATPSDEMNGLSLSQLSPGLPIAVLFRQDDETTIGDESA